MYYFKRLALHTLLSLVVVAINILGYCFSQPSAISQTQPIPAILPTSPTATQSSPLSTLISTTITIVLSLNFGLLGLKIARHPRIEVGISDSEVGANRLIATVSIRNDASDSVKVDGVEITGFSPLFDIEEQKKVIACATSSRIVMEYAPIKGAKVSRNECVITYSFIGKLKAYNKKTTWRKS